MLLYRNMSKDHKNVDPHIVEEILETISEIKYGEVVITVHDSKVVQIEKKEKKRFV